MNIIYMLLIISFFLVGVITALFMWTVGSGQYDDLDAPSLDILNDDDGVHVDDEPPAGPAS